MKTVIIISLCLIPFLAFAEDQEYKQLWFTEFEVSKAQLAQCQAENVANKVTIEALLRESGCVNDKGIIKCPKHNRQED